LDHEIVMIAQARGINMSQTLESVLRSMIGEIDPAARMEELKKELTVLEAAADDRVAGPLAVELKALREAYSGRPGASIGMNENWVRSQIKHYPKVRARFSIEEVLDLMMEG
jgi:hypothetical protein